MCKNAWIEKLFGSFHIVVWNFIFFKIWNKIEVVIKINLMMNTWKKVIGSWTSGYIFLFELHRIGYW